MIPAGRGRWLVFAIAWMLLIFWFSGQSYLPAAPEHWLDFLLKKSAHAGAYALLWYFWYRASHRPLLALVVTLLYALTDEVHQTFVAGRNGWWVDVVIDAVGAVGALLLVRFWLGQRIGFRRGQSLDQNIAE